MKQLARPAALPSLVAALDRALGPDGASALDDSVPVAVWRRALVGPASDFLARPGKELRTTIVRAGWALGGGDPHAMPERLPLVIELLHAGSLIIDRVKGLAFDLAIQGAGSVRVDSADVDQVKLGISGAGSARLAGRAASMTATVRGTSSLDAEGLSVKDAVIGAEGPAVVRASVANSAKVDALGLAAVTLNGRPSCSVNAKGSASVTGCR